MTTLDDYALNLQEETEAALAFAGLDQLTNYVDWDRMAQDQLDAEGRTFRTNPLDGLEYVA